MVKIQISKADPKPASKRMRGLMLTEEGLQILRQALTQAWEASGLNKGGKLRREEKAILLDLNAKTVDRIFLREPVNEGSLAHAFNTLKILFLKERYCVSSRQQSGNLPSPLTSFIGREKEIAHIKSLVGKFRLITLTGTGGCGKSRLTLEVGAGLLDDFPEGVWLIELAPLSDPTLLAQTLAGAFGLREETGKTIAQTLQEHLKARHLLLLLDNCEHVLDACVRLLKSLLKHCPKVTVLANSRERLGIAGEQIYKVPSLALPPAQPPMTLQNLSEYEAVRLFIDRARTVSPEFELTEADAQPLVEMCVRLDGIPLAIELAAARVRSLSVKEIHARLENRFLLLKGGCRTALPRHQTLKALIDWSYDLLLDQEKALLCRLSVFVGAWRLGAAESVCTGEGIETWEVLDHLTALVDKNVVMYENRKGKASYHLLETVRQYGRDRLAESGESDAVQRRYQDYFLALAEEAEPHLSGGEQSEWLELLEEAHENLRAALNGSLVDAGSPAGLRFCGSLSRFWLTRGYLTEGRELCTRALGKPEARQRTSARAKVLFGVGELIAHQGDAASARAYHEEGLAIRREVGDQKGIAASLNGLGNAILLQDFATARTLYEESLCIQREINDKGGIATALGNLGLVATAYGDYATARSLYEECLCTFREMGARRSIASLLGNLGLVALHQGDYASARTYQEESLTIRKEVGDQGGIAEGLNDLGQLALYQDDYAVARIFYEQSLTINRKIGDRNGSAISLIGLGNVVIYEGDYATASDFYKESLALFNETGDQRGITFALEAFADLAVHTGKTTQAAVLCGAAEKLREAIGSPLSLGERKAYDDTVAKIRQTLGESAFAAAWSQGRSMPREGAIDYAVQRPG